MTQHSKVVTAGQFHRYTRFAIASDGIGVVKTGQYAGCIELRLGNHSSADPHTLPGGKGLALAGVVESIYNGMQIAGRYALIAGFDEVFQCVSTGDGIVLLRPLGVGLDGDLARSIRYAGSNHRKRRLRKKHSSLALKYLRRNRVNVISRTGWLPGLDEQMFFVHATTKRWSSDRPLTAFTFNQARRATQALIAHMRLQGWTCGEADASGRMQPETASTTKWYCERDGQKKQISLEYGVPQPLDDEDARYAPEGDGSLTVEQIADRWDTWARFDGFSGETCGNCYADFNVYAYGPGWFCHCGHYNCQSFSCAMIPHEHPDYGPRQATIRKGADASKWWQEYDRKWGHLRRGSEAASCTAVVGLESMIAG